MAGRSNLCDFRKRSGNSVALSAGSRRDGLGLERSLGCAAALSGLLLLDKMSLGILVGAEEVSDLLGKTVIIRATAATSRTETIMNVLVIFASSLRKNRNICSFCL